MAKRGKLIFRSRRTEAMRETERAWNRATWEIASEMEAAIQRSLGIPYPPASKPGGLPHRRSRALQSGVRVEGGKGLSIRDTSGHGGHLEHGTINMAARPWARRQFEGALGNKWAKRLADRVRAILR